jgi:hypothetical protein
MISQLRQIFLGPPPPLHFSRQGLGFVQSLFIHCSAGAVCGNCLCHHDSTGGVRVVVVVLLRHLGFSS